MSSNYSANQYEGAFKPHRMQNWGETKHFKERPTARLGHTTFIADERGHLLPGVKKGTSWPDFKGTWDLPARIPAHSINPTGRSVEGLRMLESWGFHLQHTGKCQPHRGSKSSDGLRDAGEQTREDVQQDGAAPSPADEAGPASQDRPVTGSERAASQNQDSEAAVAGSAYRRAEQATGAPVKDGMLSRCCAAEEEPALSPAAEEGTHSRPAPSKERPESAVSEKTTDRATPASSKQRQRCIVRPTNII